MIEQKTFDKIMDERKHQDRKWGQQNHSPVFWMSILGEEFGEACKEAIERDCLRLYDELIQVAAVAIAASESLKRNQLDCEP